MYREKRKLSLTEMRVIIAVAVVVVVAIVAVYIGKTIDQTGVNSRLNGTKTSVRSILSAIVSCKDGEGKVSARVVGSGICLGGSMTEAKWPALYAGYAYGSVPPSDYDSSNCNFIINTGNDTAPAGKKYLTCSCARQTCE